ncbi:MAG: 2-hydroxyacyl-CoA dehydratase [Elusimicrobia bacterium]|nr:2-hydroxyacyl-CoA dehydratase [Elusimicrobiota bacterium]
MNALAGIINRCGDIVEDVSFAAVREYKQKTGNKALGYFPVYSPVEIFRAAGFLPVGLNGAGNKIEITSADSRFGSFICSIIKSTLELAIKGHLDVLDGMVFYDICDSARNLAYVIERNFSEKMFMDYIHLPQRSNGAAAVSFLSSEYGRIYKKLSEINSTASSTEKLRENITLYNANRRLLRELYRFREKRPHDLATRELYVLMRSGNFLDVQEHNQILSEALKELDGRRLKPKDTVRVIVEGSFCEQPPLELLDIMDSVGYYVVDDDFLIGRRLFERDIPAKGNPIQALAQGYMKNSVSSSVRHDPKRPRVDALLEKIRRHRVQAVIFLYAKFCEPGLFDYVLYKNVLDKEKIPYLFIEFEEKMWTFEKMRMELETFMESLLFEYA